MATPIKRIEKDFLLKVLYEEQMPVMYIKGQTQYILIVEKSAKGQIFFKCDRPIDGLKIRKTINLGDIDNLTARSAAALVQATSKYGSRILIEQGSKVVNAKSLMGVLSLNVGSLDALHIVLDGDDEAAAFEEIYELIQNRFSAIA